MDIRWHGGDAEELWCLRRDDYTLCHCNPSPVRSLSLGLNALPKAARSSVRPTDRPRPSVRPSVRPSARFPLHVHLLLPPSFSPFARSLVVRRAGGDFVLTWIFPPARRRLVHFCQPFSGPIAWLYSPSAASHWPTATENAAADDDVASRDEGEKRADGQAMRSILSYP